MRVIDRILGRRDDTEIAHRLHHLEHHHAVDVLTIPSSDVARRRLRATTVGGEEVAVALSRDQTLFDGAVLVLDEGHALVVRVGEQSWLRLVARDKADALELGYHAGNLHWRVRFDGEALLVALDGPVDDYLVRLGALATDGRLTHSVVDPVQAH
ncbi:urease accessory protein UreE [Methylobacterium brachythecii]|uniref:Urease accessory protein UreE n=1 Tax=Methylobacterium brachythecii TaxID=1176177 RepID=A0A7W6F8S4_9HYPH|nr:urease accessory protein UreE [Methylobacterium brachythecii]MBB3904715.1 urease accessory protein [Methylobacterium brachythecii]